MQSRWTDVHGLKVHANEWIADASLPHVVLVHGIIVSSRYLTPLGEVLSEDFNVHAPDLPGHGESDKPALRQSPTDLAEWLISWMDSVGIEKTFLYGHSFGCQIAAETAVIAPERIAGMVIAGPTTDARARSPWKQAARWLQNLPHESVVREAPTAVRDAVQYGPSRAVTAICEQCRHRIEEPLMAATCPLVVVRGQHDPVAPEGWCRRLTALAGGRDLQQIAGAGHNVHFTKPEEVAQVIRTLAAV